MNTSNNQKNYRIGILFAIAGTSLFSLKPIFIKLAFQEGIDATTLLALRMIITLPFFLAILIFAIKTRPQKATHLTFGNTLTVTGLGFLGYYVASSLDFIGLSYISAQMERLILFTYPLMVAVLGWVFFREKITTKIFFALFISYLGVALIYINEPQINETDTALGTVFVAIAALSFAFYLIFSKRMIGLLGSLIFTSLAMISSTFFVLIQFFSTHTISDINVSKKVWGISALLSIFSTLIPSFFTSEAIHRIGATRASIMGSIGPVVTIALAVYLLGEPFGALQLTGLIFVLLGVNFIRTK